MKRRDNMCSSNESPWLVVGYEREPELAEDGTLRGFVEVVEEVKELAPALRRGAEILSSSWCVCVLVHRGDERYIFGLQPLLKRLLGGVAGRK
jgi:hypothetical protein